MIHLANGLKKRKDPIYFQLPVGVEMMVDSLHFRGLVRPHRIVR